MEITRKDAAQMTTDIAQNIMQEGYTYWIYFKGQCIPFDKAFDILKQFIEDSTLISVKVLIGKSDTKKKS